MNAEGYLEKYPQITSFEFKPEAAQIFNIGAENQMIGLIWPSSFLRLNW